MRKISIKTSDEIFYRQFLELLRSIPPFNKLRSREIDVLSEVLYQNNKYKNIPDKERNIVIFSTDTRKEMRDRLDMTVDIFNNNLSGLRKHKLLDNNNELIPALKNIYFTTEYNLQFNFKK